MPRLRHCNARPRRRVQSPCACEAFEARRLLAAVAAGAALDTNFGDDGRLAAPVTVNRGYDVALDSSGKLLVAGQQTQGGRGLGALLRFNADGSPDLSFDHDGLATLAPDRDGGSIHWRSVLPLPDGGILVAGNRFLPMPGGAEDRPVLARYHANGTLDPTFGGGAGGGVVVLPGAVPSGFADDLVVTDVVLLPGGKILAGGYDRTESPQNPLDLALWRLNPDGSPDATFGQGGSRRQDVGDQDWLSTLVAMPDGSFVAGSLEGVLAFAPDGTLRGPLAGRPGHIASAPDGKLLHAAPTASGRGIVVRRLLADGSPDPSFGTGPGGATTLDVGATEDVVTSVTALSDGGVAVGTLHTFINNGFTVQHTTLRRLDAAGVPQPGFGAGGLLTDPVPLGMHLLVAGPAGRLYTVGSDNVRPLISGYQLDPGIVVDPGGPYGPVDEGGRFEVSGAGSSHPGGHIVKYEWDADFNGFNFTPDAEGVAATLTAGGDPSRRVALRVTTDSGLRAISPAPAEVSVRNAPPAVTTFGVTPGALTFGAGGNFSGRVTDPGGDPVTVRIDFGDGSAPVDAQVDAFGYFSATHAFARGTYTVRATAADDGGGSSTRELTVVAADVAGTVYQDTDDNGRRDFPDPPFPGVTVYVDSDGDGALDDGEPRALTNDAGEYAFASLGTGIHSIRVLPIPEWRLATPPQALAPAVVTAEAGARRDFGLTTSSRISGVVFNDANASGVRDAGEAALRGNHPRNVYLDLNNDGWHDPAEPKAAVLPSSPDDYVFTNVAPGTYTVRYLPGLTTPGNALENEAAQTFPNSRGGQTGHVVTVGAAEVKSGHDFGSFFGNTPITGAVFVDRDRDGIRDDAASGEVAASGRVVYLDSDGDGALDPDESRSRTPDPRGGGGYFLPVVRGNTYTVRTVLPPGWTQSKPGAGAPYVITVDQQNTVALQGRDFGTHITAAPAVVGRHLFYYKSAFGGGAFTPGDARNDGAIAPDKAALLPGRQAGFDNVSSYHRGINGVMVDLNDLTGLSGGGATNVLRFAVGGGAGAGSQQPTAWTPINPLSTQVRRGAGVGGSDRIVAVFADKAISNKWLRVTVDAGTGSGLAAPDVFYFGNLVGETGDAASPLRVTAQDLARTRGAMRPTAGIANRFDHNRDGKVTAADYTLARSGIANALGAPFSAAAISAAPTRSRTSPALRGVLQEEDQVLF